MNIDDLNFAYKVRHALNENLDQLPASTTDRLARARKVAVSRKKADAAPLGAARPALAGALASLFSFGWAGRAGVGVAVPLMLMIAGLAAIYQYQEDQLIAEVAELDAGVLSDDLPLNAYLDRGFNAYVVQRAE
ncbi:MAG: DUF3619 family protein [Telluria sp.]